MFIVCCCCRCHSYRAMYDYSPRNDDEMCLHEGDDVRVMERCDDGWFVGVNQRTSQFGTFPGNYVDKLWSVHHHHHHHHHHHQQQQQ